MGYKYDERDVAILTLLDENARLSYREIAKKLRMHPNTVIERIKRMEREGVIERYSVVVNYRKLNYEIISIIQVDITGKPDEVIKNVAKVGYVHRVYQTTGEYDAIAIVVCKNINALSKITASISGIPGVQRTNTKIVLAEFGKDRFEI